MKKLLNIMAGMLAMAATTACTTDLDEVQLNPSEVVPPVLTVPATIDLGAMASTIEFDYTPIDYGFSAAVNYSLMISTESLETPVSIAMGIAGDKLTADRFKINSALIDAGIAPAVETEVSMWLEAGMINDKGSLLASTVFASEHVASEVIPYVWSVTGYLAADGETPILATLDMKETAADTWLCEKVPVYGTFKFCYNHDDTDVLGGTFAAMNENFTVSASGGEIDITAAEDFEAGTLYNIRLNTSTNMASVSVPDICWSLIGVNGDWNKDVDMVEVVSGIWVSPVTTMEGTFKIRYAAGWDDERGGVFTELGKAFTAVFKGDNIALPAKSSYQIIYNANEDVITVIEAVPSSNQWRVIGEGVMGSNWDADYFMTQSASGKWFIENIYIDGSFKIRNTADWSDQDRGGDQDKFNDLGTPIKVAHGGSNIALYKNFYNLEYDPSAETITVTAGTGYVESDIVYPEQIGLTGNFSGYSWAPESAPLYECSKQSGISTGYISMSKPAAEDIQFKVTYLKEGSTTEYNWVSGAVASTEGNDTTFSLGIGDNMTLTEGGYMFTVDLASSTALFHKFETVGLVGNATAAGWPDDSNPECDELMAFNPANGMYEYTGAFTAGEFKVRFDYNWDENLGGSLTDMVRNGNNIAVTEAGTYKCVLDMTKKPFTFTMTKQ